MNKVYFSYLIHAKPSTNTLYLSGHVHFPFFTVAFERVLCDPSINTEIAVKNIKRLEIYVAAHTTQTFCMMYAITNARNPLKASPEIATKSNANLPQ
jgi:hypothetical protein